MIGEKRDLTAEFVRSILDYGEQSGEFRWRERPDKPRDWNTKYAGKIAGTINKDGYRQILINGKLYYAHRLAWLVMNGEWPSGQIDHRDKSQRSNNRMSNLREATHSQNAQNRTKYGNNTSGFKGVHFEKSRQRWRASIQKDGRQVLLGRFATAEEARDAYDAAARLMHGEFARLNGADSRSESPR